MLLRGPAAGALPPAGDGEALVAAAAAAASFAFKNAWSLALSLSSGTVITLPSGFSRITLPLRTATSSASILNLRSSAARGNTRPIVEQFGLVTMKPRLPMRFF